MDKADVLFYCLITGIFGFLLWGIIFTVITTRREVRTSRSKFNDGYCSKCGGLLEDKCDCSGWIDAGQPQYFSFTCQSCGMRVSPIHEKVVKEFEKDTHRHRKHFIFARRFKWNKFQQL